ncbi:hypothetical protein [Candidatus Arthromitus sp. SFB-rat-Yit]|uniref:hypothetical protein n=1 Tax=Candidatus Arthromitus sp. SFB-rat-Yit TaxID=1041504 RepID=UPI000227A20A|nr:hypothetical protein [Candidatus Arthromitus sp. SFB-rat-Yit]BAK81394.1 hypothetical protein RATSFB_0832 [Candidatus Arthromitus sp. SFB-rat-Yit]
MNKLIKRYKFVLGILIFCLLIMIFISLSTKIKVDKFMLMQHSIGSYEDEFKQAKKNAFLNFKNDLLNNNIILDNIEYLTDDMVRFDINQNMYIDDAYSFLEFLNNITHLRINRINIMKNKLEFSFNISAEM